MVGGVGTLMVGGVGTLMVGGVGTLMVGELGKGTLPDELDGAIAWAVAYPAASIATHRPLSNSRAVGPAALAMISHRVCSGWSYTYLGWTGGSASRLDAQLNLVLQADHKRAQRCAP
jgi:hypothetical protein